MDDANAHVDVELGSLISPPPRTRRHGRALAVGGELIPAGGLTSGILYDYLRLELADSPD